MSQCALLLPLQVDFYLRLLEDGENDKKRTQTLRNRRLAAMNRWDSSGHQFWWGKGLLLSLSGALSTRPTRCGLVPASLPSQAPERRELFFGEGDAGPPAWHVSPGGRGAPLMAALLACLHRLPGTARHAAGCHTPCEMLYLPSRHACSTSDSTARQRCQKVRSTTLLPALQLNGLRVRLLVSLQLPDSRAVAGPLTVCVLRCCPVRLLTVHATCPALLQPLARPARLAPCWQRASCASRTSSACASVPSRRRGSGAGPRRRL